MGRLVVAAAVAAWAFPVAALVNSVVPEPYMDEIFHVPQAQQYCRGDFWKWDPMITTPPGLYYVSLAYIASFFPVAWMFRVAKTFDVLCSTAAFRSTNVILAMVCTVLFHDLLLCIRPGIGERKAATYAILVALYPVHWFFTFLYYTDVASLAAVLAMYLFFHSLSTTSFMDGLSSRVGATHWNATSKILFNISSFTASVNIGSSMSLTLPLWYLLKAHLTVILSVGPLLASIGRRPERISRSKIP